MELVLIGYLIIMNVSGFVMMGRDKKLARSKGRRIPEKTLFWLAAIGGAVGVGAGMRTFRHKTKHASFQWGIPLLILLNAGIVYYLFFEIWGYGRA